MPDFLDAGVAAVRLIGAGDADLVSAALLSLRVSATATLLALALGLPLALGLAIRRFPGRGAAIVLVNGLLGLPPVLVGLVAYLLLSRAGPLGDLGLLFTPAAMTMAQTCLTLPIIVALTHRQFEPLWADYGDALNCDAAGWTRAALTLCAMNGAGILTAFLAAFGRAIAEVGAVLIVGGNIRGVTRTMTTAITLETSRGDLPLALAFGLILLTLSIGVSAASFALRGAAAREVSS